MIATDFTSSFWDYLIMFAALGGMVFCALLLWRSLDIQQTHFPIWDNNLTEKNNQVPRWWILVFAGSILFALLYVFLYPALGTGYAGFFKWTSDGQFQEEKAVRYQQFDTLFAQHKDRAIPEIAKDELAMETAARIFYANCAQCHGLDARGRPGYPNLTDNNWMYGGQPENILTTIAHGRKGVMSSFQKELGAQGVKEVVHAVKAMSGLANDPIYAARGRKLFEQNCAVCHGAEGKGNPALGAPNLTVNIWLYGGTEADLIETVSKGREALMPAQKPLIGELKVRLLAAYVWRLSNNSSEHEAKQQEGGVR